MIRPERETTVHRHLLPSLSPAWRTATIAFALIAILAIIAACGGDDPTSEPTAAPTPPTVVALPPPPPEATATPAPATPAPTPAPTPVPTTVSTPAATPVPTAQGMPSPDAPAPPAMQEHVPMGSLRDLEFTPNTLGSQLFDPLSADEVSCIKGAIGEEFYEIIKITPIASVSGDISQASFLFDCLEVENIVLLSVAFLSTQAGGWEPPTRDCIIALGLEHPEAILVRMGLDWRGDAPEHATETLEFNVRIYNCLSSAEKQAFNIALWAGIDRNAPATGADLFDLLSSEELACVQRDLSPEQLLAIAAATPLVAITIGNEAGHCLEEETNHQILVQGIHWALGGLSEESQACLVQFADDHPEFLALLQSGLDNMAAMDPEEFVAITDSGTGQYACMTDDELARVQEAATIAMSQ